MSLIRKLEIEFDANEPEEIIALIKKFDIPTKFIKAIIKLFELDESKAAISKRTADTISFSKKNFHFYYFPDLRTGGFRFMDGKD